MRKTILTMAGMAAAFGLGAPAYANVTCDPDVCVFTGTKTLAPNASFSVSPKNVGPGYVGDISAAIKNIVTQGSVKKPASFTDVFNFTLPVTGTGGGSITNIAASLNGRTDIDFTSVLVNGVAATIQKSLGGIVELAFASGVKLKSGDNNITVTGLARGNGSYGGNISFISDAVPAVPEMATWGMMILGFGGMGAAMRRQRNTTVTFGDNRAFA
jgi:hypothetical protein